MGKVGLLIVWVRCVRMYYRQRKIVSRNLASLFMTMSHFYTSEVHTFLKVLFMGSIVHL